jgi:hypothetical protein
MGIPNALRGRLISKACNASAIGLLGGLFTMRTAFGQGTLYLNNYDSGYGIIVIGNTPSPAPAPVGTFVEVLAGASANSLSPVSNFVASGNPNYIFTVQPNDINGNGPGTGSFFDAGYGRVPAVAPGATAFIQVLAWETAGSFAAAATAGDYNGASPVFTVTLGTSPPAPYVPMPAVLALPGDIIFAFVPEPSIIALGGLGAATLLLMRRWNKS